MFFWALFGYKCFEFLKHQPQSAPRDDVNDALADETLKNHTYCIHTKNDNRSLANSIVREVKSKNEKYQEDALQATFQASLSDGLFNTDFKGIIDAALLNISQAALSLSIVEKIQELNNQTNRSFLLGLP